MTLTCPACGGQWLERAVDGNCHNYGVCDTCGFSGNPKVMSDKERLVLREKHERAIAARTLPEGYDQARAERDKDALNGPERHVHTPQGTRLLGN